MTISRACRLVAFDARAKQRPQIAKRRNYLALSAKDLTLTNAEIAGFPVGARGGRPGPCR